MAEHGRWSAFVDESESNQRADPDVYLLGAALVPKHSYEVARAAMESLRLPGQRKLHWHTEDAPRRRLIAATIAELDVLHMVVVRDCQKDERPERRRRKCMERLLHEVDIRGVDLVHCESREPKQNGQDRELLQRMRSRKMIGPTLRMAHPPGPKEPALWLADAVVGAVVAARLGVPEYQGMLEGALDLIIIES
ncbi:MAG: hypothetical protein J2P17_24160 [Mycobacterium sp.]|nr:hypothetical protein [Mycobacterium sp.]